MNSLNLPRRELVLAFFFCSALASAQQPEIVSLDSSGSQGNGPSSAPSMSADGRFIVFSSLASNLVPNDTNNSTDVFVRDTLLSTTTRVSVSSTGQEADAGCYFPMISAAGDRVVFTSRATNLAPVAGLMDRLFVHDMQSGTTELASVDVNGQPAQFVTSQSHMSSDGRHILFAVDPPDMGPTVPLSWYVRDLQAHTTTLLVTNSTSNGTRYPDGLFLGDGRWVAFSRTAPTPTGNRSRVMILDRDPDQNGIFDETGTITREIIQPSQGQPFVRVASASRNGRFFTYQSTTFSTSPVELWLHDRDPDGDGIFDQPSSVPDQRVSDGYLFNTDGSRVPQVSDDGHYVTYFDDVLVGVNSVRVVLVHNMQTGGTFVQGSTTAGDLVSITDSPVISSDGLFTVVGMADGLVAGDTNGLNDVVRIPLTETTCEPPEFYGEANGNSVYVFGAGIHVSGSTHISADNFTLFAQYVPNAPGQFFYGPNQVSTPFGDGIRLVSAGQAGMFRLPIVQGVDNVATYQMHFGLPPASAGPGHITPGSTWNFQYVFRDPNAGGAGFNTSNAVRVTFCP